MPKNKGLFALIVGAAAGAAALFLSSKKNRDTVQKAARKAGTTAVQLKKEYQRDPKGLKKKLVKEGRALAKKAISASKATVKSKLKRRK